MPNWIAALLEAFLTRLATAIFTKVAEWIQGRRMRAATESVVDARLAAVKAAYLEAFDGKKLTAEQRAKLNSSIAGFLRPPVTGGL